MHKLLENQLRRHLGGGADLSSPGMEAFLKAVDDAYRQSDDDRVLVERSLELTSQELLERHTQLRRDVAERAEQVRLQRQRADRLRVQNEATLELTRSKSFTDGDLPATFQIITEVGARYLDVARVSIWVLDESRARIDCHDQYNLYLGKHVDGQVLKWSDFPKYFHAMISQRTITADDAQAHPHTRELTESYLIPDGITSMLDAPIRRASQVVGVLCCEHVGEIRNWSPEEELFASSLADIAALAMEVAERRRIENSLEHSLSLLRVIFESIGDGIVAVDQDQRITGYNSLFLEMWGFPEEAVKSGDTTTLLSIATAQVRDPDAFMTKLEELHRTPEAESFDTVEFSDGRVFERVSRPQWIGRTCTGRVWTFRDVTESRRAQDELLRAKRLESAGQLAGQIAHDFNNLLTPLAAYPELLRQMFPVNERAERFLHHMEVAVAQIVEINQQLLTLGRRGHFKVERFDPNELMDAAIRTLEIPDGILLDRQLAADLKPVSGGSAQLMRVLTNLIANAVDAMNGFGTLRVETHNATLHGPLPRYANVVAGEYICLKVADSGSGIPIDIQEKIFEPFFSTKQTDKKRGSGLGLSVVHSVLEDHHGYVVLESEPGRGSVFSLYLPLEQDSQAVERTDGELIEENGAEVLFADDDPTQREAVTSMLVAMGYAVTAVSSGEDAVAHLCRAEADLVILDMTMGGIDGAEAVRQIKIIRPEQRIMILSGHARNDRVEEALALGAHSFLAKPVEVATLGNAVQKAVRSVPTFTGV